MTKLKDFKFKIEAQIDALFDEMILNQQKKVLQIARVHYPHITLDDILNPDDFTKLIRDPVFNYEEGMAAGLLSAHLGIKAQILPLLRKEEDET